MVNSIESCDNNISYEPEFSRILYEINKEFLILKKKENEYLRNRLSIRNIDILFSYLKNFSFQRILRRLKIKYNLSNIDYNKMYKLQSYKKYPKTKVVVYSCIWGNYDSILEPYFINPDIDYYMITNNEIPNKSYWNKFSPKLNNLDGLTNIEINRYFKINPHLIFPEYDYSIYIDGNIRIVTDMMPLIIDLINSEKTIGIHRYQTQCIYNMKDAIIAGKKSSREKVNYQINRYKKDGFPKDFGAFECNILVRKHNDKECIQIMNEWWKEFLNSSTKRDQLSFPYVLWKNKKDSNCIFSLGDDVYLNPRFQIISKHLFS